MRLSFKRPDGASPSAAAPKEPNVTIIASEDIDFHPPRDSKKVKMLGSFVLKANAKMESFYQTPSKFAATHEAEGDEDAIINKQKAEGELPGDSLDVNEFVANWQGVPAIVIFGSCTDNFRKVIGTKCAPVQLKANGQDNNEARKKTFTFEQFVGTEYLPGHYTGALLFAEPFQADTVTFAINATNGNYYKLPALDVTDAIEPSALTLEAGKLQHGDTVTFIGSGGDAPATLSNGVAGAVTVILKSGSVWTALSGANISLQIFDAGGVKYLIETARS